MVVQDAAGRMGQLLDFAVQGDAHQFDGLANLGGIALFCGR